LLAAATHATRLRSTAEMLTIKTPVVLGGTTTTGMVGAIGEYEGAWRMAYVRGPEGIIVSLAQRIG
jgi:hypothetical protein